MTSHPATIYTTFLELSKVWKNKHYAGKLWRLHLLKHGNVPYIIKCSCCSGRDRKRDIQKGRWHIKRPRKTVRDAARTELHM